MNCFFLRFSFIIAFITSLDANSASAQILDMHSEPEFITGFTAAQIKQNHIHSIEATPEGECSPNLFWGQPEKAWFDNEGRMITFSRMFDGYTSKREYFYNTNGNLDSIVQGPPEEREKIIFWYDDAGLLVEKEERFTDIHGLSERRVTRITRDKLGRITNELESYWMRPPDEVEPPLPMREESRRLEAHFYQGNDTNPDRTVSVFSFPQTLYRSECVKTYSNIDGKREYVMFCAQISESGDTTRYSSTFSIDNELDDGMKKTLYHIVESKGNEKWNLQLNGKNLQNQQLNNGEVLNIEFVQTSADNSLATEYNVSVTHFHYNKAGLLSKTEFKEVLLDTGELSIYWKAGMEKAKESEPCYTINYSFNR